ncbi:MAG: cytochrome c [Gammaproteobacteria bacterium]|nr:cytochrome c [Gammaproteobacteria bacterium]NKB64379.1 cytochrome c [Gammaproteobacteria bacterium]
MKLTKLFFFAFLGLSVSLPGFADKDPNLKLIEARKGEMQLRSFNAGPLFGMAKGKIEYNAELAASAANNLKTLMALDMGRAWPEGTGNDNYPDATRALPAIWSNYSDLVGYAEDYAKAVNDLAANAGNGVDALKANIGALGQSCKGCHDDMRAKKKK